jgi:predicted ArsR family transcriptional regulator
MSESMFIRADEIANDLEISRTQAYRVLKELNSELQAKGFMTIAGRVSRQFYKERFYGVAAKNKETENVYS